jgi:hypothetical protein
MIQQVKQDVEGFGAWENAPSFGDWSPVPAAKVL